MKKILFLSPTGGYAGIDVCLDNLVTNLDQNQYEITVVFPNSAFLFEKFNNRGIKCYELPLKWWFPVGFSGQDLFNIFQEMLPNIKSLISIIKKEKIELVFSNTTVSLDGCIASAVCQVPHIFFMHAMFVDNIYTNMLPQTKEMLYRFMGSISSNIVCCSNTLKQKMLPYASNAICISNGIDIHKFEFMQKSICTDSKSILNIVSIGHFNKNKQQDFVIEALNIISKNAPALIQKIHYTAIGPGEKLYQDTLKSLVNKYDLNQYVTFKGFEDNVAECMQSYNLYINSSITETLPLSIMEAMACGLPVVATPTDGSKLIIEEGVSGLICETPEEMAEILCRFIKDDSLLKNMSLNARKRIENFFSVERYVKDFSKLFDSVLNCSELINENFYNNIADLYATLTLDAKLINSSLNILVVYPPEAMATFVIVAKNPLEYLKKTENISIKYKDLAEVKSEDIQSSDIVYCIRYYHEAAHNLLNRTHQEGKPFIWYIDDNYNAITFKDGTPLHQSMRNYQYEYMFENSDYVIVNNIKIYQLGKELTEKIECLPTYQIVTHSEYQKRKPENIIRFGFMGTLNRDGDFDFVVIAINKILEKYKNRVEVEFIGYYPSNLKQTDQIHHFEFVKDYDEFRAFFESREWDFALAPLSDTQFNRSKTNNKYREYSSFSIPAIYSKISTYENCVIDKENGILVENNSSDWFHAIDLLIEDSGLRKKIGANAKQDILDNYGISKFAEPLFDIFKILLHEFNTNLQQQCTVTKTLREAKDPFPSSRRFFLYKNLIHMDASNALKQLNPTAYTLLSAYISSFNKKKIVLSDIVPYQTYCEYQIEGNGNNINFILAGDSNAFCIIEIVEKGTIVFNGLVSVNSWMVNTISLGNIRGKLYMRFQSQGPDNIFRVIEIIERKALFFGKRRLCGWIS